MDQMIYKFKDLENSNELVLLSDEQEFFSNEEIDAIDYKMLSHNAIRNTLPVNFVNEDNKISVVYDTSDCVTLVERSQFEQLTSNEFSQIVIEIINTLQNAKTHMLSKEKYILDESRIYVGKNINDLKLVYLPMKDDKTSHSVEEDLKELVFNLVVKVKDISTQNFMRVTNFIKHPNFSVNNFKKLILEISFSNESSKTEQASHLNGSIKSNYTTKEVTEMPPPSKKEKLYSSLIAIILLAIIWSQMPLGTSTLLGVAFLLSVAVIAGLYVYWKKWRPGVEPITVKKKVKMKKTEEIPEPNLDYQKVDKIKAMDYQTFMSTKEIVVDKTEDEEISESEPEAPLEEKETEITEETSEQDGSEVETAGVDIDEDEIESFTITDQTTLLDDEDLKHNIKLEDHDSKYKLLALDNTFESGTIIPISGTSFKIGRERSLVNYVVKDQTVSREHVEFLKDDDIYSIRDIGSVNGTTINGEAMMPFKNYVLNSEDTVKIGDLEFKYSVEDK